AARMAESIQAAGTPRKKIKAYIRSIGQTVLEHPYMPRIMMREMASGGQALPDIAIEGFAAIIGMVAEVISSGVASGEFEDLNPLTLHLMVIGGLTYCRAAGPIIARYPAQASAQAKIKDFGDKTVLLDQVETIILSALRKKRCKE
ncbi:MAG: hypothetical protein GY697_25935, partial [Desulfobacterales bacterium]|nr:hypothetical protein [Desulfobacterales bacterium]